MPDPVFVVGSALRDGDFLREHLAVGIRRANPVDLPERRVQCGGLGAASVFLDFLAGLPGRLSPDVPDEDQQSGRLQTVERGFYFDGRVPLDADMVVAKLPVEFGVSGVRPVLCKFLFDVHTGSDLRANDVESGRGV